MENKRILYISQEISPYLAESPASLLGRTIPQSIQEKGFEVRTFMPKYGCINERRNQLHEVIRLSGMNLIIDDTDHPLIIKVATLQPARMQVYFIDNEDYFHHPSAKELEIISHPQDNDERIMFFVRGVIETVKKLRWEPAVVHCMGWISALAPIHLKKMFQDDPSFANTKVVYALCDDKFEGSLDPRLKEKLAMNQFKTDDLASLGEGGADYVALSKLAMDYSDGIVQASANVDPELLEYARATGKPFLPFTSDEELIDAYPAFYASL